MDCSRGAGFIPAVNDGAFSLLLRKLGTISTSVWIYNEDLPVKKGDVIRYTERENGQTKRGRVIADPERRYLFIAVDEHAPLLDE